MWKSIETAPQNADDILVGGWEWADEDTLPENRIEVRGGVQDRAKWRVAISSYEDGPWRRGFRHRNGHNWALYWQPCPEPPGY